MRFLLFTVEIAYNGNVSNGHSTIMDKHLGPTSIKHEKFSPVYLISSTA